jgi:RNA polymerase sigma-70 factor (ECF subfamily)
MISSTSIADTLDSSSHSADQPAKEYDAGLVTRFKAGDNDAFVEIVERYRGKMFAVGQSVLRNHADAEEIVQDTFVSAHRALAGFRGDSSLYTWLHRIAFNLSRNRYWYFFRRRRHEGRSLDSIDEESGKASLGDLIASDVPDPAREVVNQEFSGHVTLCMEKLSASQREILILRTVQDRSYGEIAETLGINVGTVKSRIARARINLRGLLAETYFGTEPGASDSCAWFGTASRLP